MGCNVLYMLHSIMYSDKFHRKVAGSLRVFVGQSKAFLNKLKIEIIAKGKILHQKKILISKTSKKCDIKLTHAKLTVFNLSARNVKLE
jgi:hypothetical protein